jgi:hypothetical protein
MPAVLEKDARRDPIGLIVPGLNRVPTFGRDAILSNDSSAREGNGQARKQQEKKPIGLSATVPGFEE